MRKARVAPPKGAPKGALKLLLLLVVVLLLLLPMLLLLLVVLQAPPRPCRLLWALQALLLLLGLLLLLVLGAAVLLPQAAQGPLLLPSPRLQPVPLLLARVWIKRDHVPVELMLGDGRAGVLFISASAQKQRRSGAAQQRSAQQRSVRVAGFRSPPSPESTLPPHNAPSYPSIHYM